MESFLGKLDRGMQATRATGFVERFIPGQLAALRPTGTTLDKLVEDALDEPHKARWAADEQLARQSVRALFAAGSFLDLPEEGRMHPGMQERMVSYMPEFDDTVATVTDRLRDLSEPQRRHLQRTLQKSPDLPMEIAAGLDRMARRTALSPGRRAQLRMAVTQVSWRLRKQNPSLIIDEYVDKVDRLAESPAIDARFLRQYQAILGQAVVQQVQTQANANTQQTPSTTPSQPRPAEPDRRANAPRRVRKIGRTPSERTVARGGKTIGLGLLVMLGGGVLTAAGVESSDGLLLAGCLGMTVGFVILLIGVLIFLVGAMQSVGEVGIPEPDESDRPAKPARPANTIDRSERGKPRT